MGLSLELDQLKTMDVVKLREELERHQMIAQLASFRQQERALQFLQESVYDQWVDPRDPFYGPNGELWVTDDNPNDNVWSGRFRNEAELQIARSQCRWLSIHNEHAICVHELYAGYVVGEGFTVNATPIDGEEEDEDSLAANEFILEWMKAVDFYGRCNERRLRLDRDGEVFVRWFKDQESGYLQVRFVEPGQVRAPNDGKESSRWGIETKADDVETVLAYWIDGEETPAEQIQHQKRGVDKNVKRGMPLLYPCIDNLKRIDSTRKNMTTVFGAQTAIAGIRKMNKTKSDLESYIGQKADVSMRNANTGKNQNFSMYQSGSILDMDKDTDFEMTSAKVNVDGGNKIIAAELRAIGSRCNLPEYMISGDASNANYSSTLVAEGPAVKMFLKLQKEQMEAEVCIIEKAVEFASENGRLPAGILERIKLSATAPTITVRDELKEAQKFQIENTNRIVSKKTWRQSAGYNNETEEANLAEEDQQAIDNNPTMPGGAGGGEVDEFGNPIDPNDPSAKKVDPAKKPDQKKKPDPKAKGAAE